MILISLLTATAAWKLVPQPITRSRLQRLISFRWSFSPPRITEDTGNNGISGHFNKGLWWWCASKWLQGRFIWSIVTCVGVETNPASHGVHYWLRLLKDLLLHEGLKVTCKERSIYSMYIRLSGQNSSDKTENRGILRKDLCWQRLTAILCFHFQPAEGEQV